MQSGTWNTTVADAVVVVIGAANATGNWSDVLNHGSRCRVGGCCKSDKSNLLLQERHFLQREQIRRIPSPQEAHQPPVPSQTREMQILQGAAIDSLDLWNLNEFLDDLQL